METKRICQCCGMPLDNEELLSREPDGTRNEKYCKWCYADGKYAYTDMDTLIEVCVAHMQNDKFPAEQVRAYMKGLLPTLEYWRERAGQKG